MDRKITDLVLYICFCMLSGSGILLMLSPKGIEWHALGLHEDVWKYIHIGCGLLMLAALLVHLALNKKWIDKVGTSGKRTRIVALVVAGIAIILIPAIAPISIL